jgi:hypothetical protein
MWNFHLVQRLAERKGASCVAPGGKERRCADLALVFGLVHLLANIPIRRESKGLRGLFYHFCMCLSYMFSISPAFSLILVHSRRSILTAPYAFPRPGQCISQNL